MKPIWNQIYEKGVYDALQGRIPITRYVIRDCGIRQLVSHESKREQLSRVAEGMDVEGVIGISASSGLPIDSHSPRTLF